MPGLKKVEMGKSRWCRVADNLGSTCTLHSKHSSCGESPRNGGAQSTGECFFFAGISRISRVRRSKHDIASLLLVALTRNSNFRC